MTVDTAQQKLQQAEATFIQGRFSEAIELYQPLRFEPGFSGIAWFRIGEIHNELGEIENSIDAHQRSFEVEPSLASKILPKTIRHHSYVYSSNPQITVTKCPLCSSELGDYSCYNLLTSANFVDGFHPVRVWKVCSVCSHLCSSTVPKNLEFVLSNSTSAVIQKPVLERLPEIGRILGRLMERGDCSRALEVGCGAGEMCAVARELGIEVTAQDVRPQYTQNLQKLLNITAICCDFLQMVDGEPYDLVLMGDVLEHFQDPVAGLQKAVDLLKPGGLLWLSTPNYQSAQTRLLGVKDPMWRVCEHLQYFSYQSFRKAIEGLELEVLEYGLSKQYPGSMELTLKKISG